MTDLSNDAKEWLEVITNCDGAEVPREAWPVVEKLVEIGLVSLGSARGPGADWRRAELVESEGQYKEALEHIRLHPCPVCMPDNRLDAEKAQTLLDELCPYRQAIERLE